MNQCYVCGASALDLHHVVYQQHVRAHGGDLGAVDNLLMLCRDCHERHHNASRRIPLTCLRDENFAFARGLMGLAAYDYLARYYDGEDPRLDALLEEVAA